MMTGDATVNRDAPIICCTAEILANIALREGAGRRRYAILDEFHYYADRERGVAWQIPLLALPQARFLLMSATLGPTERFEEALTKLTGAATATVRSAERPVPLDYSYAEIALHETILKLAREDKSPIYVVNFTQRACAEEAQNLMSTDYSTKEEKRAILLALHGMRFDSPYGKEVQKFVRHGIGIHHAGLLPKYRRLVERLAQKGMLKVICGTDTLGVGVNVPIRTVLFTKLCKFDGEKTAHPQRARLPADPGRAGRKGFDIAGERGRAGAGARGGEPASGGQGGRGTEQEEEVRVEEAAGEGLRPLGQDHLRPARLRTPEPLVSRFAVSHGMLLNVLAREDGGCKAMARLVRSSHERPPQQRGIGRTAMQMFESLVDAAIVEWSTDRATRSRERRSPGGLLAQPRAVALPPRDHRPARSRERDVRARSSPSWSRSSRTPSWSSCKQLDKLKTEKMAEMKAAGVEYDERMAELDKMEYPKPNSAFIYDTFNAFALRHPWVGQGTQSQSIRPKSMAREMFETFATFSEYVKDYGLERGEGILLRYLSDTYKTLVQSVPSADKTPEVGRDHHLLRRDRPRRGLEPPRRVGEAPRPGGRAEARDRAGGPRRSGRHGQREGVHRARSERALRRGARLRATRLPRRRRDARRRGGGARLAGGGDGSVLVRARVDPHRRAREEPGAHARRGDRGGRVARRAGARRRRGRERLGPLRDD